EFVIHLAHGLPDQHLLPGLAAVGGAVDAALGVGAEGVAEDSSVGDVGVFRVDDHLPDLPLLFPDVLPALAAVGGAVAAVAGGGVAADVGLARADVDDVGVGRGHSDGADGSNGLVVEDGFPGDARVGGLPDAAGGGARVVDQGV